MRRFLTVFVLSVYFFVSSIVFPYEQAKANPLAAAVPAGIEIGAGVYVTGAIALAALAGAFGYTQYEDDIREHAAAVWASANDAVKQSLRASIEAAVAAGKKTISISRDVYDFILSKVGVITNAVRNTFTVPESTIEVIHSQWGKAEFIGSDIYLSPSQRYKLINYVDGMAYNTYSYGGSLFRIDCYEQYGTKYVTWGANRTVQIGSYLQPMDIASVITWYNNVMAPVGVSLALVPVGEVDSISSNDIKSSGKLAWDETTDTPVIALPNSFPATSTTGKTLTWDPDAGVWKDAAGVAVPQSDVIVGSPELTLDGDIAYTDVVTGELVNVKEGTAEDTIPDDPPVADVVSNPFGLPVAALSGLLCILKAVVLYLIRLFQFIISIPTVAPKPINNAAFEWFKSARIMGVQIYTVISSLASIGLSLFVYKAVRRVFP
jgi:hypothetical protein